MTMVGFGQAETIMVEEFASIKVAYKKLNKKIIMGFARR